MLCVTECECVKCDCQVLMRALRDFNIPKIVTDDLPVFMGLIGDLFPALNVPRKRNVNFEGQIKTAMVDLHLQPEDSFILKVYSLPPCSLQSYCACHPVMYGNSNWQCCRWSVCPSVCYTLVLHFYYMTSRFPSTLIVTHGLC